MFYSEKSYDHGFTYFEKTKKRKSEEKENKSFTNNLFLYM